MVCESSNRDLGLIALEQLESHEGCGATVTFTQFTMNCQDLATRISQMDPTMQPVDVARLCLLMLIQDPPASTFDDIDAFEKFWKQTVFRLEAAADQHGAVSRELVAFGEDAPVDFNPDQLWLLLRAVKVQGQVLEMYAGEPAVL